MTYGVQDAVSDIVRKLFDLDRRELLAGLPKLQEQDRTWDEWVAELRARVNYMSETGPSQELLEVVGAFAVAMKVRLAAEEEVSFTSGEAA